MSIVISKFSVIDTFKITNRGFVLCGDILEGIVSIGDEININSNSYQIIGVEMIDKISEKIAHVGLVFSETDLLESLNLKGQTIEIIKKATNTI